MAVEEAVAAAGTITTTGWGGRAAEAVEEEAGRAMRTVAAASAHPDRTCALAPCHVA